jgi:hypothetical protein
MTEDMRGRDDYAEFLQWLRNPPKITEAELAEQSSQPCPQCGEPSYTVQTADCWSCRGDTSRPCLCCYGGTCQDCGYIVPGEWYSDDVPPEFKLDIAQALGAMTMDEGLWELDMRADGQ